MSRKLKIRSKAMLGTSHSWAVTIRSLLAQFDAKGHDLYLNSINGYEMFPPDWMKKTKREVKDPDIDITYTLPRNFKERFRGRSKLKLAIYNYESSILPNIWVPEIEHVDYVLPSSAFSKSVFVNSGWPEGKCIVVPHGINIRDFDRKDKLSSLKTKKSFKFLNVSIAHHRKNIGILVDAYYSAFSSSDDVCLIIKTTLKKPKFKFECDIAKEIVKIQKKHKGRDLPQIEIVQKKYDSLIPLYNSCDSLVSATSAEGFGLPFLEAMAAGLPVIAPNCSGHLDFLNDKNSLLVDVREIDAGDKYQYWKASPGAKVWIPEVEDLADKMKKMYLNRSAISDEFSEERKKTLEKFTWENAANKILSLA
jgi:glycosyltransferase involved in cell wall biosynthesis